MKSRKQVKVKTKQKLGYPIPVRYEQDEEEALRKVSEKTGLAISNIGRLAARYVLPRVLSGEIPLSDFVTAKQSA